MSTDIESRINEAEVCRSMELYGDSLSIYENILTIVPPEDSQTKEKIEKRIDLLKKEMSDSEETKSKKVSAEDISMFKKTFSNEGDANETADSAAAFQEMGLHGEAVAEFVKLFKEDYPKEKLVPKLSESLIKLHSPDKAVEEFETIIQAQELAVKDTARLKFLLGQDLERREYRDQANDLYQEAAHSDPQDPEIKKCYDSLAATFASGSKYDYLLREGVVTTDKLQQAFALAKKMNKSVEFVLTGQYQINKEAIGKSFSLFYGCPFRAFDPEFPVPTELLRNLKKTFLLNEIWIPLSWSKEGIEILVDDPRDLNKTDNIKGLLKTGKINVNVAIREDIQEFIKIFFDENRNPSSDTAEESVDTFDFPDVTFEEEEEEIETDEAD